MTLYPPALIPCIAHPNHAVFTATIFLADMVSEQLELLSELLGMVDMFNISQTAEDEVTIKIGGPGLWKAVLIPLKRQYNKENLLRYSNDGLSTTKEEAGGFIMQEDANGLHIVWGDKVSLPTRLQGDKFSHRLPAPPPERPPPP